MLNVSIVRYKHTFNELSLLINTCSLHPLVNQLFIIDNSPEADSQFEIDAVKYIFTGRNIGYGAGHNIAIRSTLNESIPFHLIINPDIEVAPEVIEQLVQFMETHPEVGHIMPKVVYPDGSLQYLCKLLPTPADLLFRRFLPKAWFNKQRNRFELRHSGYNRTMEVPYLSGCFMLLRTEALNKVGIFDERFFMYPEDIDLTRRIHQQYKTIFYPKVQVIHHHERSSYFNFRMLMIHILNLIKYFNKWGWCIDAERSIINKNTLKQIQSWN